MVQPPALDGELSYGTEKGDVVRGELNVDHPLGEFTRLTDVSREQGTWRRKETKNMNG